MDALTSDPNTTTIHETTYPCPAQDTRNSAKPSGAEEIVDPTTPKRGVFLWIRKSPLGHLLRFVATAFKALSPNRLRSPDRSQPLQGGVRLLHDSNTTNDCIKHDINQVMLVFNASDTEGSRPERSNTCNLLQSILEADLLFGANFPLCTPDAQHVVNDLQKKVDQHSDPSSCLSRQVETIRALLRVLCWMSLRTGAVPEGFIIQGNLKPPGPEDYGSGGLHDIFRSEFKENSVALKRPRAFGMVRPSHRKKLEDDFRRCSLAAFNMHHENIVPVFGIVDEPAFNGFSLVSPWMETGDLRSHLDRQTSKGQLSGPTLVQTVNTWLLGIAKGLEYLHERGVVHGDVRGVNILLDEDCVAHLTPFGSSVIVSADEFSNPGLQSPIAWIAPELFDPKKFGLSNAVPSLATDVYAFGCTCVELYTSQSPYPGLRDAEILAKVIKGSRPQRPIKQGEEMPDPLWRFVRRCWDHKITRRPSISEAILVFTDITDVPSADI